MREGKKNDTHQESSPFHHEMKGGKKVCSNIPFTTLKKLERGKNPTSQEAISKCTREDGRNSTIRIGIHLQLTRILRGGRMKVRHQKPSSIAQEKIGTKVNTRRGVFSISSRDERRRESLSQETVFNRAWSSREERKLHHKKPSQIMHEAQQGIRNLFMLESCTRHGKRKVVALLCRSYSGRGHV